MKKNELFEIDITGFTAEGNGVGKIDGMAVFVPAAAVGDHLLVKIIKTAKKYAIARIEKVLLPSKDRICVDCAQFLQCGGCVFRHISYEAELVAKEQRVRDALERIGGFSGLTIRPIMGASSPNRYRNKAQLPIGCAEDGEIKTGFFAAHSHRIIPCSECLLQPEEFSAADKAFKLWAKETKDSVYDETTGKGRLRHLYLRKAEATGEVMACVVVNGNGIHQEARLVEQLRQAVPEMKSILVNHNREQTNVVLGRHFRTVWGQNFITDQLCGLTFRISPHSFYQVNHRQAERLYQLAGSYAALTKEDTLLDLYCGTGTIGLTMAKNAKNLIGVEIVEQAVEDARINTEINEIGNAVFYNIDAVESVAKLLKDGTYPDVVILDPPRKGCSPDLIQTVAEMHPKRIVYISCDPATLARDLKLFTEMEYPPVEVTPVDMFPRTAHVETCVLLSHKNLQT